MAETHHAKTCPNCGRALSGSEPLFAVYQRHGKDPALRRMVLCMVCLLSPERTVRRLKFAQAVYGAVQWLERRCGLSRPYDTIFEHACPGCGRTIFELAHWTRVVAGRRLGTFAGAAEPATYCSHPCRCGETTDARQAVMNAKRDDHRRAAGRPARGGWIERVVAIGGCFGGLLIGLLLLAVPAPLYLSAAWLFGLLPHDAIGTTYHAGGAILAMVTAAAVRVMGESLIEDGVKFALLAALTGGLWSVADPTILAIALGAPVGASLSLIARMLPGSGGVGGGSPSKSRRAKEITHCEIIPVGLDDVWRLFTEREHIAQWWHESTRLELREGGHFSAPWRVRKGRMRRVEGRVIAFRAPPAGDRDGSADASCELVLEWRDPRWPENLDVTLRFGDDDGNTMLEVRQLGFDALKPRVSDQTLRYYARQWQVLLMTFNTYAVRMTKKRI